MPRICPYKSNCKKLGDFLSEQLMIPMNQREYSWTDKEIKQFIDDIISIFEENKYVERLGSIIIYKGNDANEIYDGQQRTITSILLLYVIGLLSGDNEFFNDIIRHISINKYQPITELQNKIKNKEKFNDITNIIIPKIYCINPDDMDALVEIFNKKVNHYLQYIQNIDEILECIKNDSLDDEIKYICNQCNAEVSRKNDFIRHLDNKHSLNVNKYNTQSNIYKAYSDIYERIRTLIYDHTKLIELHYFIINDIDLQLYECTDGDYVSKIFEWENNRGSKVSKLDLIKNPILIKIPDDKKLEIYEEWEQLRKLENNIYSHFGQRLFDIAIQIYNGEFNRILNFNKCYKSIIDSTDVYKELKKLFTIINKLNNIYKKIEENKYGKLITNIKRISLQWESYMWCLLPIFYKKDSIDDKLLKLLTKWYFRNLGFKTRTFNNFAYSNECLIIVNDYFKCKDNTYDYYSKFYECLKLNADQIIIQYYQQTMQEESINITNATYLLLFLETCENTDKHIVNLEYTLEHIFPQKEKEKLTDSKNIGRIGNLTLLEGTNSENGHKGNSSLGAKRYDIKKNSYLESSSKITRDVVKDFPNKFAEEDIKKRTGIIVKKLDKYTNYII